MKKGAKQGLRDLRQPVAKEPPKITFPCDYPLKVVGDAADDFPATVCQVIVRHAPDFDETTLEESYMAFMSARGRATVARQDDELLDESSTMEVDEREIREAVS